MIKTDLMMGKLKSKRNRSVHLRRAGVDRVTAMKIVGHKSEHMHHRYNPVPETDLAKAAAKITTYLIPADIFPEPAVESN